MNHYRYEELKIGQKESFSVTLTQQMQDSFREITGDVNPLHANPEYAAGKGHPGCVVFGMLTASFLSRLAGVYLPGEHSMIQAVELKMRKPVYIGDTLTVCGEITDKSDAVRTITVKITITSQNDVKVAKGEMRIGVDEGA